MLWKTHHTVPFPPAPPHPPWCLLLHIIFSHHSIWLPTNNSLNSVKSPFGELIFSIKRYFSLYVHQYVSLYRRDCTHLSEKRVWVSTENSLGKKLHICQYVQTWVIVSGIGNLYRSPFFALMAGTCSLQAEEAASLCSGRVTGSLFVMEEPLSA